ncbi:MAG: hypothetical protein N2691_02685 [Patescibacteria group bacterium]|nr:hypothetical protein [Patescibacteria group bacterium]
MRFPTRFLTAHIRPHFHSIALFLLVFLLFVTNYKSDTYLSGWDNLQTELYPWLAVKRAFFASWQEYQSFGLASGLAHASDILRALIMWVLSFVLPEQLLRYLFHFGMVFLAALGMFKLLEMKTPRTYAFTGSVFYILNIGTIQYMALPLESFSAFLAALPWLLYTYIRLIDIHTLPFTRRVFQFFLANILATPAFYIQTTFLVYGATLVLVTIGVLLVNSPFIRNWLKIGAVGSLAAILVLVSNLFWLAPQIYFLATDGNVVKEAKSNSLSTDDLFYLNQEKGTVRDFALLEGFYFDLNSPTRGPLFQEFKMYFTASPVAVLRIVIVGICVVGIPFFRRYHPAMIGILLMCAIALLSITPPFSNMNELIRRNETLNQIFRAPFTKFVVPYVLVASYFFTHGLLLISTLARRFGKHHKLLLRFVGIHPGQPQLPTHRHDALNTRRHNFYPTKILPATMERTPAIFGLIAVLIISFPAFLGNYINKEMRVRIPDEYKAVMAYLKDQDPSLRIGLLPEYTHWGWYLHRWGYNGSGFLWYGIEQPIVSRTFDVWSDKSESYYWEIKAAIDAEDPEHFARILEKYSISFLLLDKTLIPVSSSIKGLQYDRIEILLKRVPEIEQVIAGEQLQLYRFNARVRPNTFVTLYEGILPNIGPPIKITNYDPAYHLYGTYKTDPENLYYAYFPYADFTTQTTIPNSRWKITKKQNQIEIASSLPRTVAKNPILYKVVGEDSFNTLLFDDTRPATISGKIRNELVTTPPEYPSPAPLNAPYFNLIFPAKTLVHNALTKAEVVPCGPSVDATWVTRARNGLSVRSARGGSGCVQIVLDNLEQRNGYLVHIKSLNQTGRPFYFYALDRTKSQGYIEDRLKNSSSYYVFPPLYRYGVGYNLTFQNTSYSHADAVNTLEKVTVYYLPYTQIANTRFVLGGSEPKKTELATIPVAVEKPNYYTFIIQTEQQKGQDTQQNYTLVLHQQFQKGWKAYAVENYQKLNSFGRFLATIFPWTHGKEITSHILVNNWANGWEVQNSNKQNLQNTTIIISFVPQHLQYAGYGALIGTVVVFLVGNVIFSCKNGYLGK